LTGSIFLIITVFILIILSVIAVIYTDYRIRLREENEVSTQS
jgi:cell division protein FtsL